MPGNRSSHAPVWSPDGKYLSFMSSASNLVASDTNQFGDLFIWNEKTGGLALVSRTPRGELGNGNSGADQQVNHPPVWSPDSTRIAFLSAASNFASGDNNDSDDLFVKNLRTGLLQLVDSGRERTFKEGVLGFGWDPIGARISFTAGNPAPKEFEVFVKNLRTGSLQLVSTSGGGDVANGSSFFSSWSPDGAQLSFSSSASNLIHGVRARASDGTELRHDYIKDLRTGMVVLVGTSSLGTFENCSSLGTTWSPDGRRVAFVSNARNLATKKSEPTWYRVFIRDLRAGTLTLVSGRRNVALEDRGFFELPAWSPDGSRLLFAAGGGASPLNLFVSEVGSSKVTTVSTNKRGAAGNGFSREGSWSPDGTRVLFSSDASNLVAGTAGHEEIFVKVVGRYRS